MQQHAERFANRFSPLFAQEGLTNIKFFLKNRAGVSQSDFLAEAVSIQDTIAAGDFLVVESVDGGTQRKRFDAPF